ncbi:peptidoglycan-binding protein [Metabacillus bambusae]|uniref:Autolysin n=1 Tax=Metabacillus bambusae TaxID=2795218 RepID=A0ABS3NBJ3_9BACI|nr:peptidoglycan-binding protein [Metabacillus bambusae]MBO1515654.1 peptidoglycan-binding protein [Metabacillus bambusae]
MTYTFQSLPQLIDLRGKLASKGDYSKRTRAITHRVWHHSLTKKHLAGSDAASFAAYHVNALGWPGVGYSLIIEPKNVIQTSKGPRARIVYANDIDRRTYHVGNSNQFSLGICVAGDYRYDTMDDATIASIADLHASLIKDNIGKYDTSHNEMPGYSWKACCVYDYRKLVKWEGSLTPSNPTPIPDTYIIQEGDTFWSIAHKDGAGGVTVNDLIKANPGVDPTKLKVGQKILFGKAKVQSKPVNKPNSSTSKPSGNSYIKKFQQWLNTFYKADLVIDGVYGPKTKAAAIKALQTELNRQFNAGLVVDGKWGPKTHSAIRTASKRAEGNITRIIQGMLYCLGYDPKGFDGDFGNGCDAAVREFQDDENLSIDGRVGKNTFSKMF